MKQLSWPLIFLLVIALLVQNTCPHGYAGKSTLGKSCGSVTKSSGHCQHHAPAQDGIKSSSTHHNPDHPPLFLFSVPEIACVTTGSPISTPIRLLDNDYKDALPDELLKPPRA